MTRPVVGATEGDTFIISSDGTAYTTNTDGTLQRKVIASKDGLKQESIDRSFQYYDNIRGKINSEVLKELVEKHNAESPNLSKNDRLHQWGLVAREYCQVTGQQKSRTTLMKKMTSAKYYRDHEGRPGIIIITTHTYYLDFRSKGCYEAKKDHSLLTVVLCDTYHLPTEFGPLL